MCHDVHILNGYTLGHESCDSCNLTINEGYFPNNSHSHHPWSLKISSQLKVSKAQLEWLSGLSVDL